MQHCGCKLSLKSEKWKAISQALNGALQKKRLVDKGLIIADCRHIITVTLALSIYTLQAKQLFTHKPDEQSRKNKLCIIAITSFLAVVQTASYKNG